MESMILLLFTALTLCQSQAAKVLVVPGNINSHIMYFGRLADLLAQHGHTVQMLVPSNAKIPFEFISANAIMINATGKLTIERYAVDGDVSFSSSPEMTETMVRAAMMPSIVGKFRVMIPFISRLQSVFAADCSRLLENAPLLASLRSTVYDVAVMDPAFADCYVLPYTLAIPNTISLGVAIDTLSYRVPRLPSYVNDVGLSDRMSFVERLMTFCQTIALSYTMFLTDTELSERFAADRPPVSASQLLLNSSMWFYLEEPAVAFPRPLMPNTIQVGDLMAGRPGRPLPVELEQFISSHSPGGIIVVSFGSFLDHVPDSVIRLFCDAFSRLDRPVGFVWKQNNKDPCFELNTDKQRRLLTIPWLPQNDLLADGRVRAFITHGGLNSIVEAAYHGKPMVVVPISLDQPANAAVAVARGFAVRVELSDDDLAQSLSEAIRRLLDDPSYERQAKLVAGILGDRRDKVGERTSDAIEQLAKYGCEHLRTGAFELNVLQYLMFDVFLTLCVAVLLFVLCFGVTVRAVWRRCCVRRTKTKND